MNEINRRSAFTLIELSIVLVAISLIVVGILSGKDLLRASAISGTISQVNAFKTAINLYILKYDEYPGDHRNAWDYYDGSGSAICGANAVGDGTQTTGCNGNGDGRIDAASEDYRSWQHLELSTIMPTGMSGYDAGTPDYQIGVNTPKSKIKTAGFWLHYDATYGKNVIALAAESSTGLDAGVLIASEAISIDKKVDDGTADSGAIRTINGNGQTGCTSGTSYDKSGTLSTCRVTFYIEK